MRICYFTPVFLPDVGGAEYVTDALARTLTQQGHHVHVLTRGRPVDLDLPYPVTWYRKTHFPHHRPERVLNHLRRLHRREAFDVFLVNYGRPTGIAAVRLTARTGVPTVLVSHGGDLYEHSEDRRRPRLFRRTVEAYATADAAIAISPHIEQLIREIRPASLPLARIPNGVDPDALHAPAHRPEDLPFTDQPFLLALGNLTEYKGFDDAIDAFALAQPQLSNTHLAIVGQGKMLPILQQKIHQHRLAPRVHLLGQRTGNDKRWLMQHCRFGLMPSLEEGHPIVGLEFMALHKPVVCSLNPAFNQMFVDGQNAFRVPAQNPDALAQAIINMHRSDLDAMGHAGLPRLAQFEWPAIAQRYAQVMQDAIAHRRKTTGPSTIPTTPPPSRNA